MLKAVQNLLPTRMECSALQTESLHLGVPDHKVKVTPNQTKLMYTEECQELQRKREEAKYVYTTDDDSSQTGLVLPEIVNSRDSPLESMEVDSSSDQGVVNEGNITKYIQKGSNVVQGRCVQIENNSDVDSSSGQVVVNEGNITEYIQEGSNVEQGRCVQIENNSDVDSSSGQFVVNEDNITEYIQEGHDVEQGSCVQIKDNLEVDSFSGQFVVNEGNITEYIQEGHDVEQGTCVQIEDNLEVDSSSGQFVANEGNITEYIQERNDVKQGSCVQIEYEDNLEATNVSDVHMEGVRADSVETVEYIGNEEESVNGTVQYSEITTSNLDYTEEYMKTTTEKVDTVEEAIDVQEAVMDEEQVDGLSTGEVVVGESGTLMPSRIKHPSLPKHMFTTHADDTVDSVVDVVGVTEEEEVTSAVDDWYLECPVPSPPSTIAYGESDNDSVTLDGIEDPDTLSKDLLSETVKEPLHQEATTDTISENEIVDIESTFDLQSSNAQNGGTDNSVLLPEAVNKADKDVPLCVPVSGSKVLTNVTQPVTAEIQSDVVQHSKLTYTGNTMYDQQDMVQSSAVLPESSIMSDAALLQSLNNVKPEDINMLSQDIATTQSCYVEMEALQSSAVDQAQTTLTTDDIVIDENEGTQVLMENPDGTRFLLNPDGTQVPVHTDELGNNYVMDADGLPILLQTAEEQSLADIVDNQPLDSTQAAVGDSGLMESYLNTQVTQTGVGPQERIDYTAQTASGIVVNDGSVTSQQEVPVTTTQVIGEQDLAHTVLGQGEAIQGQIQYVTETTSISEHINSQGVTLGYDGVSADQQIQYITEADGQTYTVQGVSDVNQYNQSVGVSEQVQPPQFEYVTQENSCGQTSQLSGGSGILNHQSHGNGIEEQFEYVTQPTVESSVLPDTPMVVGGEGELQSYINADATQVQYVLQDVEETNAASAALEYGSHGDGSQMDFVAQSMRETGIFASEGSMSTTVGVGVDASIPQGSNTVTTSAPGDSYYILIDGNYHKIDDPQILASLGITASKPALPATRTVTSIAPSNLPAPTVTGQGYNPVTQQFSSQLTGNHNQSSNLVIQYPSDAAAQSGGLYSQIKPQISYSTTSQKKQPSLLLSDLQHMKMKHQTSASVTNNKSNLVSGGLSGPTISKWETKRSLQNLSVKPSQYSTDLRSLYGVGSSSKYESLKKQSKGKRGRPALSENYHDKTTAAVSNKPMYYMIEGPKDNVTKYYLPASHVSKQQGTLSLERDRPVNGIKKGLSYRVKPSLRNPVSSQSGVSVLKPSSCKKQPSIDYGNYTVITTKGLEETSQNASIYGSKGLQIHKSWINGVCVNKVGPAPTSTSSTKCNISVKKAEKPQTAVTLSTKEPWNSSKPNITVVSGNAKKNENAPVVLTLNEFINSSTNTTLNEEGKSLFVVNKTDTKDTGRPSTVIKLISTKDKGDTSITTCRDPDVEVTRQPEEMEMTSAELMDLVKQDSAEIPENGHHTFQEMFTAKVSKETTTVSGSVAKIKDNNHADIVKTILGDKTKKKEPHRLSLQAYLKSRLKGPNPLPTKRKCSANTKNIERGTLSVKPVGKSSAGPSTVVLSVQKKPISSKTYSDFMCQVNMGITSLSVSDKGLGTINNDREDSKGFSDTLRHDCGTKADVGVQASAEAILSQMQLKTSVNHVIGNFRNDELGAVVKREGQIGMSKRVGMTPVKSEVSSSCTVSPVKYKEGEELFEMECESFGKGEEDKRKRKEKVIVPRVTPQKEGDDHQFHQSTVNEDPDWIVEARRRILLDDGTKSVNADRNGNKIMDKKRRVGSVEVIPTNVKTDDTDKDLVVIRSSIESLEDSINSVIKVSSSSSSSSISSESVTDEGTDSVQKTHSSLLHSKSCDQRNQEVTQPKVDPRASLFEVGVDCKAKHPDGNTYDGIITQVNGSQARCYIDFLDKGCEWCQFDDIVPPPVLAPVSLEYVDENIVCFNCRNGRDEPTNQIVICDACGKGFHQLCHSPVIESSVIQEFEKEWICCICRPVTPGNINVKPLPYDLKSLTWNSSHTENAEQVYCYCGSHGNWFLQMLQCRTCLQWFHQDCVSSLHESLLLGDQFYVFLCSICNKGQDFVHRIQLRWVDVAHLGIFHLGLCLGKRYLDLKKEILPWVNKHWKKFKLPNQPDFDKKQRYRKLEEALSDVHYMNKFRNGKKAKKSETCWALKVRAPPPTPCVKLPLMHPLTAANTKHYRWKPIYKLSNIDCGTVTWNFAQPQMLNRKRKMSENSDPDTSKPCKKRKLDAKGTCAKEDSTSGKISLKMNIQDSSLSLLEKKIPELSSYSGVNHPFLLEVERSEIEEKNRKKAITTRTLAEVELIVEGDMTVTSSVVNSQNDVGNSESTTADDGEGETRQPKRSFNVLAKRLNSDRLEYLIDWYL